jgi:hypothetical protein
MRIKLKLLLKSSILWDITPCRPLKVNVRQATCFTLVSCLAYSSTVKMEAKCSSETSVDIQRTTRCYIPEDGILHNHRCENLKYYGASSISYPRHKREFQRYEIYSVLLSMCTVAATVKAKCGYSDRFLGCDSSPHSQSPSNHTSKLYVLNLSATP